MNTTGTVDLRVTIKQDKDLRNLIPEIVAFLNQKEYTITAIEMLNDKISVTYRGEK